MCRADRPAETADLILTNGAVYAMDPARPRATAVAVAKGEILCVGEDRGALPTADRGDGRPVFLDPSFRN